MRLLVAAICLVAVPAFADDRACILAAAERLPRVAGLVVGGSKVRPVPAALLAGYKGDAVPVIVDIDITAAGQSETYSYMCLVAATGQALVRRVVN